MDMELHVIADVPRTPRLVQPRVVTRSELLPLTKRFYARRSGATPSPSVLRRVFLRYRHYRNDVTPLGIVDAGFSDRRPNSAKPKMPRERFRIVHSDERLISSLGNENHIKRLKTTGKVIKSVCLSEFSDSIFE